MEHPQIDDDKVLDHYLVGQLSPDDETAFEEHLFECDDCLEKVQWGEELRRGLMAVVTEDMAHATVTFSWLAWLRQLAPAQRAGLLTFALMLALLPAALVWQQFGLRDARSAVGGASELSTPIGELAVVSMGVVRDTEAVEIRLDPAKEAVLLSLELPAVDASHYRVTLRDASGGLRWRGDELEPNLYDTLMVVLPSTYLAPGSYRLTIEALHASESRAPDEIEFRVLPQD